MPYFVSAATGNNLVGDLPAELSLLTGLNRFLAPNNFLAGDLDVVFGELTSLQTVVLSENNLEGPVPTGILTSNPNLGFLDLGGNQYNGTLPSEIFGATKLSTLRLDDNQLTGSIPTDIINLSLLSKSRLEPPAYILSKLES